MADPRRIIYLIAQLWNDEPIAVRVAYERRARGAAAPYRNEVVSGSTIMTSANSYAQQNGLHPQYHASTFLQHPPTFNPNVPYFNTNQPPMGLGTVSVSHHQLPSLHYPTAQHHQSLHNPTYPFGHPEMSHLADQIAAHDVASLNFSLDQFTNQSLLAPSASTARSAASGARSHHRTGTGTRTASRAGTSMSISSSSSSRSTNHFADSTNMHAHGSGSASGASGAHHTNAHAGHPASSGGGQGQWSSRAGLPIPPSSPLSGPALDNFLSHLSDPQLIALEGYLQTYVEGVERRRRSQRM